MNIFDLTGKVVIVTGGAGHLGHAMSEALLAYGATVYILGQNLAKNEQLAAMLNEKYQTARAKSMAFNIDDTDLIGTAFNAINKCEGHIDVLVNNAAYAKIVSLDNCNNEDWAKGIEGTINATARVTRAALPYMQIQKSGSIINIGSMYGMVAPDMRIYGTSGQNNPASYGAGKAAIIQLTKYIASVYGAAGIRANAVSPGPFPNPDVQKNKEFTQNLASKNPMNRIGEPRDLMGIIVYLASDASSYTNGQNIAVDGGWTAW